MPVVLHDGSTIVLRQCSDAHDPANRVTSPQCLEALRRGAAHHGSVGAGPQSDPGAGASASSLIPAYAGAWLLFQMSR
ncbi:hypothetical protein [Aquisalimonas sp.]|uniref:hypothetical protein n=1 Tax=Aquisalimonas sp. TaxID=1872621 RepID=UPI0025BBF924|nr:hypothetical protein [Aquisalimonas sp.]